MPAKTKAQQMAAGAELRRRRSGSAPQSFEGMSTEKLKHFASTKRKGLPARAHRRHRIAEARSR